MTLVDNLQAISIASTASPKINGATTQYKVLVTAQTPIIDGDKLEITFPSTIKLPDSQADLSCAIAENLLATSC